MKVRLTYYCPIDHAVLLLGHPWTRTPEARLLLLARRMPEPTWLQKALAK